MVICLWYCSRVKSFKDEDRLCQRSLVVRVVRERERVRVSEVLRAKREEGWKDEMGGCAG